ncbi:hypothetical protein [Paractinoplanes durhamensis]|uniref:hypothetical protein n=1 Tax=Paractinoplanes durhamensis TaxID=113563 RepID=UPI00362F029E
MQLDLNLLTVLDALLEEGSVAGAAERLRLSSPRSVVHWAASAATPATTSWCAPAAR